MIARVISPRITQTIANQNQPRFTFRVSGFSLEPTNIITEPITIFNANTNGTRFEYEMAVEEEPTCDKRFIAMRGDHEPIIVHHYKQNPKQYFLFQLEIFLIEMQVLVQKQLQIQILL